MRTYFFAILLSYFFISCQTNEPKINEQVIIPTKKVAEKKKDTGVIIYLTFDDGPYLTTPSIDSVLSHLRIKASFFIVGSQMGGTKKYDSTFLAVKNNPLYKLYNHTYSHAITKGRINRYYAHPDSVWLDIIRNKEFLGLTSNITRLPGSNAWKIGNHRRGTKIVAYKVIKLADSLKLPQSFIGWDAEWKINASEQKTNVDALVKNIGELTITKRTHQKHVVVLLHDFLFRTDTSLAHLTYFVEQLQQKFNCRFEWVENYPGV
jgi:peptidoglycan/xylan/chitin deacetylase (PgdA/CDA1 family)